MSNFAIGSEYSGFILQRREEIAEIDSTVLLFTHKILGTPALAIKNNDPNKTFCIAFNTLPEDSTGVAHILEHSVLMGSRKYPVKDVFGEIHKGGLMTFLNAMTGSDITFYPFATLNQKEYFNIMDVYCDVVFNPLLERTTFEQEGWHYHQEAPDQPLEFQGVVFNEMKGAFSDPIRTIFHHAFSGLMPGSTYAHESGGDPGNIPDLSYEEFVAFYHKFYHPSNAMLFFYGDADLQEELAFVQNGFLAAFSAPAPAGQADPGQMISSPVTIEDSYTVSGDVHLAGKTYLAVATAIGPVLERQQNTAFQVIAQLLYNSDASPLKKSVLQAGLCKDFGGLFIASSSYQTIMMTYLIGSESENREQFTAIYTNTLEEMVRKGLDRELVLAELNKYEFSFREALSKSQRGLDLIGKAMLALKYGGNPIEFLQVEEMFGDIRRKALEEGYFEELIRSHLLDNPATVEIILKPDTDKSARLYQAEQKKLDEFADDLDAEGRQQIIDHTLELIHLQNTPNDEATLQLLPQLTIGDLDPKPDYLQVDPGFLAERPFLSSVLPTNSISYIDFGFDVSVVPSQLLPLLDLFATIVTEIGTETKDYMLIARELATYTGGFDPSFNTYTRLDQPPDAPCSPYLWFNVKILQSFLEPAIALVSEIFTRVSFADRKRIREIVLREFAWAEHSAQSEGYQLASSWVFAHLSDAGRYNEYVNGVTSYLALKDLATNYEQREEKFLAALEQLRELLFRRQGVTLAITSDEEGIASFREIGEPLVTALPDRNIDSLIPEFTDLPLSSGFCTSAEVVFNVQGCALLSSHEEYNGHLEVLKTWISRDYLWNSVRQRGGAYGCFVRFNHITGNIGFISYRDPNVAKTYAAYNELAGHIARLDLSRQVLDQLIIGTYGNLVPHQSPAARGAAARNEYLSGVTSEYKQQRLDEVLRTTMNDLTTFAPFFAQFTDTGCYRATIGNGEKIRAAKNYFDEIIDI